MPTGVEFDVRSSQIEQPRDFVKQRNGQCDCVLLDQFLSRAVEFTA